MKKLFRYALTNVLLIFFVLSGEVFATDTAVVSPETCVTALLISPENCTGAETLPTDPITCAVDPTTCRYKTKLWGCTMNTLIYNPTTVNFASAIPLRTHLRTECYITTPPDWYCYANPFGNQCILEKIKYLGQFNDLNTQVVYDERYTTMGLVGGSAILRSSDKGVIKSVTVRDYFEALTIRATFIGTCTIILAFNEPDVDNKAQAQQLIDDIQHDVTTAMELRDAYQQLIIFSRAYYFLASVVDNFFSQLSNDTIQDLRILFSNTKDTLKALIMDSSGMFPQEQRIQLFNLYLSMFSLGNAADWQNPDGTTMTIEQYLGPDAISVFNAVKTIEDKVKTYDDAYKKAAIELATYSSKLALAKVQLVNWLP